MGRRWRAVQRHGRYRLSWAALAVRGCTGSPGRGSLCEIQGAAGGKVVVRRDGRSFRVFQGRFTETARLADGGERVLRAWERFLRGWERFLRGWERFLCGWECFLRGWERFPSKGVTARVATCAISPALVDGVRR
jgi:hypothetical protein